MVEVTGLEPTTFWSLTRRATKLRYTSESFKQYLLYLKKLKMQSLLIYFNIFFKTFFIIHLQFLFAYDIIKKSIFKVRGLIYSDCLKSVKKFFII